jgi:fructose-1,6-bisphosphatase/inositol monophosphatase family enzyme
LRRDERRRWIRYACVGISDGFWELNLCPGHGCGALIVAEAGGRVTDRRGAFSNYKPEVVASNAWHDRMLEVLKLSKDANDQN